jgi:hypothetical protein
MTKRLKTPPKSNCQRVHEGRSSGPCINCKREEVTNRYWHLSQRRDQPLFYTFVKNAYAFKDDDCICRMCEARFRKSLEMSHDTEETSSKRKFRSPFFSHMFMCCKKHTCFLLQSLFSALTAVWSVNSHGSNDKLP